jgi:hypothetical protein
MLTRRIPVAAAIAFAIAVGPACTGANISSVTDLPQGAVDFPSVRVDYRLFPQNRERTVIRDRTTWVALWARLVSDLQPAPPVPDIDFSREMIVVASMGLRPTGGFSIRIEGVYEAEGQLYVTVRETSPGPTCVTIQVLTAPVDVHRVAVHPGPVNFVERATTSDC